MTYSFGSMISVRKIDAIESGLEASILSNVAYGIVLGLKIKLSTNYSLNTYVEYAQYNFYIATTHTLTGAKASGYKTNS